MSDDKFMAILSRESCRGGPGFNFTPEGWFWLSDNPWNNGMMEKWNID